MKRLNKVVILVSLMTLTIFAPFLNRGAQAAATFDGKDFSLKTVYLEYAAEYTAPANWPTNEPPMLVFMRAQLVNNTGSSYDGTLEFPIPANVKRFEIVNVGEFESTSTANGDSAPVDYKIDSDRKVVTFTPSKAIDKGAVYEFGISFVYNPFEVTDVKDFSLDFVTNMDVDAMQVNLYLPVNAKDQKLTPEANESSENAVGETLYVYNLKDIKAGETRNFKGSYVKPDNTLFKDLGNPDATNSNASSADSKSSNNAVTVALIIAGAIIIFGILIFFGLRSSRQPATRQQQRQKERDYAKQEKPSSKNEEKRKALRKKYIAGDIDETTYNREVNKLK